MRKATRQSTGGALTASQVSAAVEAIRNAERRISREETIESIKSYFKSDEVQVASKILSLICPISKARIGDAARGVACRHLECFDLRSYLQLHTTLTFWECPFEFCRAKIPREQLRVSDYLDDVLREFSDNISSIELRPDGSHTVILPPPADVTINDEEPFEADFEAKPTIEKKQVGDKRFACSTCAKQFRYKCHRDKHELLHTGVKPYACSFCSMHFADSGNKKRHERTHTGERPYKCDDCAATYRTLDALQGHVRSVHTGEKPFECTQCGKRFTNSATLRVHQTTHASEKLFKCHLCDYSAVNQLKITKHIRDVHERTQNASCECAQCGKTFTRPAELRKHQMTHTGVKAHSCVECGKKFRQKSHLELHARTHSGEKPFECDVCGKRFAEKSKVSLHKRIHSDEKPYECDQCKKRFRFLSSLNKHKWTHTDERPYKAPRCFECSICQKTFPRSGDMSNHMRTHTGEKPFPCEFCEMKFIMSCQLTVHRRKHTGEKPYKCEHCPKAYTTRENLKVHMVTCTRATLS